MVSKCNKKILLTIAAILFLELLCYFIYHLAFKIEFVSREELVDLEIERIRLSQSHDPKKIFFGHIDYSLDLLQRVVNEKAKSEGRKIVIVAGRRCVPGSRSASNEIYLEILRRLSSE